MSEITHEQWTEYQAEKAEHERQEMARFFDEFWRPIVCNQDGTINQDKLNAELWDYYTFMGTAAKVYDGITGGRVSKINTLPEAILAENEDHLQRCIQEAVEEETEDLRSRIATLEAQVEQAREALEGIVGYWNRDRNDEAMHDACWRAIETAEAALQGRE